MEDPHPTRRSPDPQSFGNQPAPYRGLSGPPGPKCRKSLENVSRDLRPWDPTKSPKSPGDSPKTLSRHFTETLRRLPGLCPGLFGVMGPEGTGDIFEIFLAFWAQRARETSARGGLVPNRSSYSCSFFLPEPGKFKTLRNGRSGKAKATLKTTH